MAVSRLLFLAMLALPGAIVLAGCPRPAPQARPQGSPGAVPEATSRADVALPADTSAVPSGWVVSPRNAQRLGEAGYRVLHQKTGIEMVYVPSGSFLMGSEEGDDQKPPHRVELDGFWLGRTEVTVGQWRRVMGSVPRDPNGPRENVNDRGDEHPVQSANWEQARTFCSKLGLVLPTEAQWEYAARGPQARAYPWGDTWDAGLCQSSDNLHGHPKTAPVGSLPEGASWCGALDLAGNVWEWCWDCYEAKSYGTAGATARNPEFRDESYCAVQRGGSWRSSAKACRSATRSWLEQYFSAPDLGFRVSLDPRDPRGQERGASDPRRPDWVPPVLP